MINVHHRCPRALTCYFHANIDGHGNSQRDSRRNKRTMEIDHLGLALAGQGFSNTLSLDSNLEANSGASSAVTSRIRGRFAPACASLVRMDRWIRVGIIHLIGESNSTNSCSIGDENQQENPSEVTCLANFLRE